MFPSYQASSIGGFLTGNKNKSAEKIQLWFQDHIFHKERFSYKMFPWIRIDELKKQLVAIKYNKKVHWQLLRFFYKNIELSKNNKKLFDYNIEPFSTIVIMARKQIQHLELGVINPYDIFKNTPEEVTALILKVQSGLQKGFIPKLAPEGTSGSYFLENQAKKHVAIFKPYDQEPYADNNPRNYEGNIGDCGIRKGILSGQAATRQVAAYMLDQKKFHSVPTTTYVQFYHPTFKFKKQFHDNPIVCGKQNQLKLNLNTKHGSLQQFMQSHDIAGNIGSNCFQIDEVHKIGILDIRILNLDRNQANILVRKLDIIEKHKDKSKTPPKPKKFYQLIPIDHGLSFPDNFQIYDYQMVWMGYQQSHKPFSPKSLQFINSINPIEDCNRLREKLGFRQICLRNFRIAETFLKKAAQRGFNLHQIGSMIYRPDDDDSDLDCQQNENKDGQQKKEVSQLQRLVRNAQDIYFNINQKGIEKTIEYHRGVIKIREKEEQYLSPIKQVDESPRKPFKKILLEQSNPKLQRQQSQIMAIQKPKVQRRRNSSLPILKQSGSNMQKLKNKKRRKRQGPNGMYKAGMKPQIWQQKFFYIFEDLVDRFLDDKLKKQTTKTRNRLNSQTLDLD